MRLFKSEKSDASVSEPTSREQRGGRQHGQRGEPRPKDANPTASLADDNASIPAGWYPDPENPPPCVTGKARRGQSEPASPSPSPPTRSGETA